MLRAMTATDPPSGSTPAHPPAVRVPPGGRVALFVTCLVETFRPSVALASVQLLEAAGFAVTVPDGQTCCGQPNYNAGDRDGARSFAQAFVERFEGFAAVVAPSGSCAAMARIHIPKLLDDGPLAARARALGDRTFELVQFLHLFAAANPAPASAVSAAAVTYHDSCSGLRELGIKHQPRALLARAGIAVSENAGAETCCGFGGTFCVKFPAIAERIADDKIGHLERSGASLVTGGDLGCLLHLAGRIARQGGTVSCRHVAELLAGEPLTPAIGEPARPPTPGKAR
jgi:L-lactate dehydrogenase complex protein LldE